MKGHATLFLRSSMACIVALLFSTIANAQSPYCDVTYSTGCDYGDQIDNVNLANLDRTNSGCANGAYEYYTGDTIELEAGSSYTLSVSTNSGNLDQGFRAWIDYDDDVGFGDPGEELGSGFQSAGTSVNMNFTVPNTADSSGYTRMRIVGEYNGAPSASDSCGSVGTWGETEDYVVDIKYPTCHVSPTDLSANFLNADSVELAWTENNGGGNSYMVEWGPAGFAQGNGNDTVMLTGNPDTITGFSNIGLANVGFYIREVCSPGDSTYWGGPTFATLPCAEPYAPHYFSGFEQTPNDTPYCWSSYYTGNDVQVVNSTDNGHPPLTGSQMLELNDVQSQADTVIASTPMLDGLPDGDKQIRFHGKAEEGTWGELIVVGTMSDPQDPNSWVPYDTMNSQEFPEGPAWEEKLIKLNDTSKIPDGHSYLGFSHRDNAGGYEFYIDDFSYEFIPDSNVGIASIIEPVSGVCVQDSFPIRVVVENPGNEPQTGFDISYTIDGGTPTVETYGQTLQPFTSDTFTFTPSNFSSSASIYDLSVFTTLPNDTVPQNDSASKTVSVGGGSLNPSSADSVGIPANDTIEDTLFVCGSRHELYGCGRVLSVEIDSLIHEDALDELDIQLVNPEGTTLDLWMQLGGSSDQQMMNLVFTDTASENVTGSFGNPRSGSFLPQDPAGFAKFDGETLNGMWRLRIMNDDPGDTAVLKDWSMQATDPEYPEPDLGADTTICQNENLLLDPGQDPDWGYAWDNGSNGSDYHVAGSELDTSDVHTFTVSVTDTDPFNRCTATDSIKVDIDNCTGLEERGTGAISFDVHPNPASDRVFIESDAIDGRFRYDLVDLQGRTVQSEFSEADQRSRLDVSDLSQGVYILKGYRERNNEELFQEKIVVE